MKEQKKNLIDKIQQLSPEMALGDQKNDFINQVFQQNLNRIKYFFPPVFIIIAILLYFDISRFNQNIPEQTRLGAEIIFFGHIAILLMIAFSLFTLKIKNIFKSEEYNSSQKFFIQFVISFFMILLVLVSLGDILVSGSVIAYFGTIFAYAVFITMGNGFSVFVYGFNLSVLLVGINLINLNSELLLNMHINLAVYTFIAWLISRYLFHLRMGAFRNIREKERLIKELKKALENVDQLSGLLPICSHCKKIRDDSGYWNQMEQYLNEHSEIAFSHSICPDCVTELYPDLDQKVEK